MVAVEESLFASSTVLTEPMETIETERLCPPFREGLAVPRLADGDQGIDPARAREAADGTLKERVDRWLRAAGGGRRPALFFARSRAAVGERGEGWRGRPSALGCLEGDDEDERGESFGGKFGCGERATFRKIIVHLTSSPAKTTWSCQCTKTRMFVDELAENPSGDMVTRSSDGRELHCWCEASWGAVRAMRNHAAAVESSLTLVMVRPSPDVSQGPSPTT